jgi:hypothetical protein
MGTWDMYMAIAAEVWRMYFHSGQVYAHGRLADAELHELHENRTRVLELHTHYQQRPMGQLSRVVSAHHFALQSRGNVLDFPPFAPFPFIWLLHIHSNALFHAHIAAHSRRHTDQLHQPLAGDPAWLAIANWCNSAEFGGHAAAFCWIAHAIRRP